MHGEQVLQNVRTDAPLVTMCCMASCTTDATLVASYLICAFHSLRPAAMIGSSNDDFISTAALHMKRRHVIASSLHVLLSQRAGVTLNMIKCNGCSEWYHDS